MFVHLKNLRHLSFALLLLIAIFTPTITSADTDENEGGEAIDIQAYANDMQPGWNLGNTFDAVGTDETAWGNPAVTKEFIQNLADQGYKSIRIPVTFDQRQGAGPEYTIDPDFLNRVDQVVQWSIDEGLYVMINIHHDSWIWVKEGMETSHDETVARYNATWTQLADHFKDHSTKLMFESLNEPQFNGDTVKQLGYLKELNASFYDIVRNSGGKNDVRPLVLPTLNTGSEQEKIDALYDEILALDDPNIIATVHYYGFWPFSVNIAGVTTFNEEVKNDIITTFDRSYDKYIANGIPVVLGEFGLLGFDTDLNTVEQGEKLKFFEFMIHYANEKGITHMLWDNGQHFGRESFKWSDPALYKMMSASWETRSATAESDFIFLKKGEEIADKELALNLHGNQFETLQVDGKQLVAGTDYELNGDVLTVKASLLSDLTSEGKYGTNAVLTLGFNKGADWTVDVITYDNPVFESVEGETSDFAIPTQFNGDRLATMEAKYADGSNAGPQNWTSFKEFAYTFTPIYDENEIVLKENFFNEVNDGDVELTFHFWSGDTFTYTITKNGSNVVGVSEQTPAEEAIDIQAYAADMQPGWNLGNTFDAVGTDETAWGNPFVTQEFIQNLADQGYMSIRIPVTFDQRQGEGPDYTINPDFLDRLEQVVQWSMDEGLYVMINIHHDSWIWISEGMKNDHDATVARYNATWTQLADRFKDHSTKLMFESLNEPQFAGEMTEQLSYLKELNSSFYEIVRNSGGKNDVRPLVLPTLNTGSEQEKIDALYDEIIALDDPNIIATVHYYGFWPFSVNVAGYTTFNEEVKNDIITTFDKSYDKYIANGIPVVLGEYGLLGFDTDINTVEQGEKLKFFEFMIHYANEKGITHMLWDNGQHFGRESYEWSDPSLYKMMSSSWETRSGTAESDFIFLKKGEEIADKELALNLHGNQFETLQVDGKELVSGTDYELNGDVLTVKANLLSDLTSSGEYGKNAVLTLGFNNGADWTVDVITYEAPVFESVEGETSDFAIPTQFNGDRLATMEAKYADGSNAGPQNWTSFKEFAYTFTPSYDENEIVLKENFFNEVNDGDVELTFHFWSGDTFTYTITKDGSKVVGVAEETPGEDDGTTDPDKEEEPKDPGKEEEPKDPGKEEEPKDPGKEEEPKDSGKEEEPTDPGKEDGTKNPGKGLPNTATSQYNYLLIGVALILFGGALTFYYRKRKIGME